MCWERALDHHQVRRRRRRRRQDQAQGQARGSDQQDHPVCWERALDHHQIRHCHYHHCRRPRHRRYHHCRRPRDHRFQTGHRHQARHRQQARRRLGGCLLVLGLCSSSNNSHRNMSSRNQHKTCCNRAALERMSNIGNTLCCGNNSSNSNLAWASATKFVTTQGRQNAPDCVLMYAPATV